MSVIPGLRWWRHEGQKFQVNLGCLVKPYDDDDDGNDNDDYDDNFSKKIL